MEWFEVTVFTSTDGIDPVCGRLYQLGINGVSIEDETEFQEFLESNHQIWDYVDDELVKSMHKETSVKFYLPNTPDGMETLTAVKTSICELLEYDKDNNFGRLAVEISNLKEEDWANNWKKYFHPLLIGDKILIKPEWEDAENSDDRIVFNINPGMSFGTGSHHTTKMCIEQLEKIVNPGDSILDLGCGSGILFIISLMLGANSAFAVDVDPLSAQIACQNAKLNNIDERLYKVVSGNLLTDEKLKNEISKNKYDIVAANIVADVIISISSFAYNCLKDNGCFITSGIIDERMSEVEAALKTAGFEIENVSRSADWAAYCCKKVIE